jgi:uncharacterized protein YecE (DUF72 family)
MKTESELDKWVTGSAEYLKEKMVWDDEFERRAAREGEALPLRTETKSRLEDALKRAKALKKSLYPLVIQARDNSFPGMETKINKAYDAATDAVVACTLALTDSLPQPGNRTLQYRYHRSAVNLAIAFDDKNARSIAGRIIEAAGLAEDYSEQSMDNWLKEIRDKDPMNYDPK